MAVVVAATSVLGTTASNAAPPSNDKGGTVVIGGRTIPKSAVSTVTGSYVVPPGGAPVGVGAPAAPGTVTPMYTEGSSYAWSQEVAQFFYKGYGRAGGNVSTGNSRIVRVCIWFTRGTSKSPTKCSDAIFSGGRYSPGPEVQVAFSDTLNPYAGQTKFNYRFSRIDPNF